MPASRFHAPAVRDFAYQMTTSRDFAYQMTTFLSGSPGMSVPLVCKVGSVGGMPETDTAVRSE
jgi:hypothetical protein